jgi:RimJ/RimL family protein N-acetyltransferase
MMADPTSVEMAAFTAEDPADRVAFDKHMQHVAGIPGAEGWAVTDGDRTLVGTIARFPAEDDSLEVTYWIARPHWNRGHASRALTLLLDQTSRPVLARVAADNLPSHRVLEKAGFTITAETVTTPRAGAQRRKSSSCDSAEPHREHRAVRD